MTQLQESLSVAKHYIEKNNFWMRLQESILQGSNVYKEQIETKYTFYIGTVRKKMQYIYIVNTLQNSFFNKLLISATIFEAFLGLATSFYRITTFIIIINYSVLQRFWPLRKRLMGCNHYCKILFFTEVFTCSKVINAFKQWNSQTDTFRKSSESH